MRAPNPLGSAELPTDVLTALVGDSVGRPVELDSWKVEDTGLAPTAVSTAAVLRVAGTAHTGATRLPWSIFVKILQSPRHFRYIDLLPADLRDEFIAGVPWRDEADALGSELPSRLPPGIRTPRVLRLDELGDDRIAMWLEDVVIAEAGWDRERFTRAARLLGRWAARRSGAAIPPTLRARAGHTLRMLAAGRLERMAFPQLRDDHLWAHPLLAATGTLRDDLRALAAQVPEMLDHLDALPQAIGHGDACPQNLLVPADAPDTFVAVDICWQWPQPIGYDLGQLLVGLAHTGDIDIAALPSLHDALVSAYLAGLHAEGCRAGAAEVTYGCDASLVIRSCFTAIPFEKLTEPITANSESDVRRGIALTRYLADLGLHTITKDSPPRRCRQFRMSNVYRDDHPGAPADPAAQQGSSR